MNKRQWAALFAGALTLTLLAACGGGNTSQPGSASAPPEEPDISVIAPVEPEPEPEPVYPYSNPLTGEGLYTDISGKRPVAVMFNNLKKALPQVGVSRADVIYEIVAEGGITRMMGVFQDLEGTGDLACVRSARDYYASLAYGHDAIFIHAGGSPAAYDLMQSRNMSNIDFVNGPYYQMCWRDPERKKSAGTEHSLFTSSEKVLEYLPEKFARTHSGGFEVGWTFDREAPEGGAQASRLTVPFSKYKTGYFTYDQETGLYQIEQHINGKDVPYVDGANEAPVAVSNVLVLYTDVNQVKGDDKGRMSVRTTGSGDGLLLRDGLLYEITWQRDGEDSCYAFLDRLGHPIPLAVGSSYINVVALDSQTEWE